MLAICVGGQEAGSRRKKKSGPLSGMGAIHVSLVGVLRGDVDGSYAGATGAQDLDTDTTHVNYFTLLLAAHKELSPSQFGVYPYP
jgi:hypothetical protein